MTMRRFLPGCDATSTWARQGDMLGSIIPSLKRRFFSLLMKSISGFECRRDLHAIGLQSADMFVNTGGGSIFIVSKESDLLRTAPRLISCVPPILIVDGQKRSLIDIVVVDAGDADGAADEVGVGGLEGEVAELM